MIIPGTTTVVRGPLFDGRAERAIQAYLYDVNDDIAREYRDAVVGELRRVVRHPTPYYWTKITADRDGATAVVHDQGVVYGPWLAGVGSRNATSRFKGYAHWRIAGQLVRRRVPGIMQRLLRRSLPRMGG